MTTDRKLLEMAAKAAGIAGGWDKYAKVFVPAEGRIFWNPLTDDGDALRLAVKLKMDVDTSHPDTVFASDMHFLCTEPKNIDPFAATRRAIVHAAAEIGKTL